MRLLVPESADEDERDGVDAPPPCTRFCAPPILALRGPGRTPTSSLGGHQPLNVGTVPPEHLLSHAVPPHDLIGDVHGIVVEEAGEEGVEGGPVRQRGDPRLEILDVAWCRPPPQGQLAAPETVVQGGGGGAHPHA